MTKLPIILRRTQCAAALITALVFVAAAGIAPRTASMSADSHSVIRLSTDQLRGSLASVDGTNVLPRLMLRADALMLTPSPSELEIAQLAQDERCLAEAIYYEARGEGTDGQMAIAEVVFHRLHHHGYPGSICGVVYQGVGAGISCQFSFVCNGEMLRKKTPADWYRAKRLAARIISGIIQLGNSTDGATSFHAADVEPGWSDSLERTVQIGNHIFYKPLARSQAS
jgi:cell wall hydrolase